MLCGDISNIDFTFGTHISEFMNTRIWNTDVGEIWQDYGDNFFKTRKGRE